LAPGRTRVPSPATGSTALRTRFDIQFLRFARGADRLDQQIEASSALPQQQIAIPCRTGPRRRRTPI